MSSRGRADRLPAPKIPPIEFRRKLARELLEFGEFIEKQVDHKNLTPELRERIAFALNFGRKTFDKIGKQTNFMRYVKHMWPGFIEGRHHAQMAKAVQDIVDGENKRYIIAAPPRSTKSEFFSVYLPSFYLGQHPDRKFMQFSNKKMLATKFGGTVKAKMDSKEYNQIYPFVWLSRDAKSKEAFETEQGGRYVAMGVGAKAAGEGGDVICIDDPHSEQDIIGRKTTSKDRWEFKWDWFNGIRQRLQPRGNIVIVATRWHALDITGRCLREKEQGIEDWQLISIPAIEEDEEGNESSYWPEWKQIEELQKLREVLPKWQWHAQYMQHPVGKGVSTIRTEWWRNWDHRYPDGHPRAGDLIPPSCTFKIQVWDTSYGKNSLSDYSACTTWGVFTERVVDPITGANRDENRLILIDAVRGRWEFPELKDNCRQQIHLHKPDVCLVEAKVTGISLIQEMARSGIYLKPVNPDRGPVQHDLRTRLSEVADIFRKGMVFAPLDELWAKEVVDETAQVPFGENDDFAATVWMAVRRFRQAGFIRLPDDPNVDEDGPDSGTIRPQGYY